MHTSTVRTVLWYCMKVFYVNQGVIAEIGHPLNLSNDDIARRFTHPHWCMSVLSY